MQTETEPVLNSRLMRAEASSMCHRMSAGLFIEAPLARLLPTRFQSCFEVLEAFTVLDKPALNFSQLW